MITATNKLMICHGEAISCESFELRKGSHQKRAQNIERDEVRKSHARPTKLVRRLVRELIPPQVRCDITLDVLVVRTIEHDVLPGFSGRRSKQDKNGLREGLEIVVATDCVCVFIVERNFTKHLEKRFFNQTFRFNERRLHAPLETLLFTVSSVGLVSLVMTLNIF